MKYYNRTIETLVKKISQQFPIVLITGPRQVGKSTLLKHLFQSEYQLVSLDDPLLQNQIAQDPMLFMQNYASQKLIIDEVQYNPELFPYLKMSVDQQHDNGKFILTGSQSFVLMNHVTESLAGRVAILNLQGTSLREQVEIDFNLPFLPKDDYLEARETKLVKYQNLWEKIHRGYLPRLVFNPEVDWRIYYESYLQSYIERDIRSLTQVGDERLFLRFMIALAARSGELLNYQSMAKDLGVSIDTIKRWVSILEASHIIYLLRPYSNNHLKRAIKTPKVYFLDTGLLAYLTGWPNALTMMRGAQSGNIFETFILSDILKSYLNAGIVRPPLYFYRDRDGKEIDLLIENGEDIYPIEIKASANPTLKMAQNFSVLNKIKDRDIKRGTILCQYPNKILLSEDVIALPIEYI